MQILWRFYTTPASTGASKDA